MTLRFGVLGPLEVWSDGEAISIRGAKRRGLLAYLLAHAGEPHSLDRIVDAVWGEAASTRCEATVQTYVSQLRKLFGEQGPRVERRAGGYVLELNPDMLDASRFEASIAAATALDNDDRRIALLDDALNLWRGEPLAEFAGQAWADNRARQLTRLYVLAHQLRVAALLDAGRHRDALPVLEQLVTSQPLHEPFWAQLIIARYRSGQQADALAAFGEARNALATELGVEPGPQLVDLQRRVLAHDVSLEKPEANVATTNAAPVRTVVEPLPDGVVTLLLTDIVDSTVLWETHPEAMAKALARHEDVIADVVHGHGGRLLKSRGEGDATLSVFARATDSVAAAVALQRRLGNEAWPGGIDLPTRIAVHTGEAQLRNGDYYGGTVNRAARIRGLAAGGQVFVSRAVHDLVIDVLPTDLEIVGIGDKQMKGLQRRESVYEIRGPALGAPRTMPAHDLMTRPRTSFVGRASAIGDVEAALRDPGLVTLVGPGGIGKTRLALETLSRVRDNFDCVHFVELASVFDAEAVIPAFANAVGAGGTDHGVDAIIQTLGRDRALLVTDNCEHLIDACARTIDALTKNVPALTVLATSRIPLEVLGEVVVAVEPLERAAAVRLLVDRSGRREPVEAPADRDALHEIARRLDCIPLALELTGARLRSMSATDLVARLPVLDAAAKRPATERHATMRAALDWSYELLSEKERAVLRRLAVFAGFTIEAAEHVVGSAPHVPAESDEMSELIGELVAHSMIVFDAGTGRYRLLEPVRQYATDLLEHNGESAAARDRHAKYYAETAERVTRAMRAGQQQTTLDDDLNNIEAALDWTEQCGDDETLCRIVGALGVFWFSTSAPQGVRWTRRAVARRRDVPLALWASVLLVAGQLAQTRLRDNPDASAWLDEAVAIYRELGRDRALGWALFWQARLLAFSDPSRAKDALEEALALFRGRDDALGEGWALYWLGSLALERRDDELFFALADELQELAAARVPALFGLALCRAAYAKFIVGDNVAALTCITAAEKHQRDDGDRFNLVGVLFDRAWLESKIGSRRDAVVALRQAVELDRQIGGVDEGLSAVLIADILLNAGAATEARELLHAPEALDRSKFLPLRSRWSRERAQSIEARLDLSQPSVSRFADYTAALDWVLEWTSQQLEHGNEETESPSSPIARAPDDLQRKQRGADVFVQPPSSLIGRTDVLARMSDALDRPGCLTLVGVGGVGKTRLLEEACTRFVDRFERVWRIDLVAARDRAGVENLLEAALLPPRDPMNQSTETGSRPDLVSEIASRLGRRRVLIALDNCEQLIDVLPTIIEALLARASGLTVLATSREPLSIRGELVLPVAPLDVPHIDSFANVARLQEVESVALLITRARERGADLGITPETADDIANICRQLDGIPLALELAAARLPSTSLADLSSRLAHQLDLLAARRGEERHRTLRGAIDWSYDLLEPVQQTLLRRLGIFIGGFTLEAAEEVCADDDVVAASTAVYLNLAELAAKSVVVFDREQGRYRLLEPIRQFARELLESSDELPLVADRHARWAFRHSTRASAGSSMQQRFEVELDNVHAALDWLRENDHKRFLRFVSILGFSWCFIDWRRGLAVAEVAVSMATDASERLRAGVFLTRGIVEQHQDVWGSTLWLDQARDLYLRNDEPLGVAWSTFFLAGAHAERHPTETRRLFLECVERFHNLGVATGEMWSLLNLVHLAQDHGRIDEASDHLERMVSLAHRSDQSSLHGVALALHARNTASRGNADAASREMREAIEVQQANDERYNLQQTLSDAAWIELQAGRVSAAEDYVRWALRLGVEIEHERGLRLALVVLAVVESRRGNNEHARLLMGATGWDRNQSDGPPDAVWVRALQQLEYLDNDDYEPAAQDGRALGVFGAARACIR